MFDGTLCLDRKLDVVAIGPFDEANALDLLDGKFFDVLSFVANQTQAPNAAAIREGEMSCHPAPASSPFACTPLPVIVLEAGIALLAWLVGLAVLIETGDGKPCAICCGLTGLAN